MQRSHVRHLLVTSFAALLCAGVTAAPAPLDTEARAQASLVVPLHVSETLPSDINFLVGGPQRFVEYALGQLAPITTYSEIAAAPDGLTFDCTGSGTFTARALTSAPFALRVDFRNCIRLTNGILVDEMTGAMEVTLFDDNLQPAAVAGIRVGTADEDFLVRNYFASSPDSVQLQTRNLRIAGRIPVVRDPSGFDFYGRLSYQMTGFYRMANPTTLADGTVVSNGLLYEAEALIVDGHRNMRTVGDLQIGDFVFEFAGGEVRQTFFDTASNINQTRRTAPGVLSVRSLSLYQGSNFYSSLDVDGDVRIDWSPGNGAGCVSGDYSIQTTEPWTLTTNFPPYQFSGGASRINDGVTVRFSQPRNPTLRLNVRDVGNFRYQDSVLILTSALPCAW